MKQRFEPVDPMLLLGLIGLLIGGYFLTTATLSGAASSTTEPVVERDSRLRTAMYSVQPALGQAIVERALLEQRSSKSMAAAVIELNRALLRQERLKDGPMTYVEAVRKQDTVMQSNHAARVQYVMGRAIVNWTQRGVKSGLMPLSDKWNSYTQRMISKTDAWGIKMGDDFASARQTNLGTAIVRASQDWTAFVGRLQEQLGGAIVQVAKTQVAYREALAQNQKHLAALVSAAARTEARADLFARLMELDPVPPPAPTVAMQPIPAPDRPGASILGLYAGLAGFLLIVTLLLTSGKLERKAA